MGYHIKKIANGNAHVLHSGIPNVEHGKETLKCIAAAEKRNKNKVILYGWAVSVNNNKVIYRMEEG